MESDLLKFVKENGSNYSRWDDNSLSQYLDFFTHYEWSREVRDGEGSLLAVALAKPINYEILSSVEETTESGRFYDPWEFEFGGPVLFIEHLVSTTPAAFGPLIVELIRHPYWNGFETVAFTRFKGDRLHLKRYTKEEFIRFLVFLGSQV